MKDGSGFSLIEFVVYMAIAAIILSAIATLYSGIYQLRTKNQIISEVEQQGQQIMQIITQTVRNGQTINSPTIGTTSASLSIKTYTAGVDPTIFNLTNGVVSIKEGTGALVSLNSNRVVVSNLSFRNLTRPNTDGIIRISFTVTYGNFTKTFYNSAAVRGVIP